MIYCFDTSAINELNDDPDCSSIVTRFASINTIFITTLNVAGILATKDQPRRELLIRLVKTLAKNADPILLPHELVQIQCNAHAQGMSRRSLPLPTSDRVILFAYRHLTESSEWARELVLPWKQDVNQPFDELFEQARPSFESLFSRGGLKRPRSFAKLIRDHYGKDDFLYAYVSSMYEGACGVELDREGFRQVLIDIPELLLMLVSYAYASYSRSIQQSGYSRKRNANQVDLMCGVYLPHCDYFVTHDRRQRWALRAVNRFNPHPAKILSYETFKAEQLDENRAGRLTGC